MSDREKALRELVREAKGWSKAMFEQLDESQLDSKQAFAYQKVCQIADELQALLSQQESPANAEREVAPGTYKEALTEACSEILKTVMEAMADPEGGIGIDQVYALVDGRIGKFVALATQQTKEEGES